MSERPTEFDYLLNRFERASQDERPADAGYAGARQALFRHVRELERKASLWNLIESMWSFPGQTLGGVVQRIARERTGTPPTPKEHPPMSHSRDGGA